MTCLGVIGVFAVLFAGSHLAVFHLTLWLRRKTSR